MKSLKIKKFLFLFVCVFALLLVGCDGKTFTVSFDYDNGSTAETKIFNVKSGIEYPEATKEGYTFVEWKNIGEGDINNPQEGATYSLKAIYKINEYTYKFVNDDDTVLKEGKANYGETPVAPTEVTKVGIAEKAYVFAGWDKEVGPLKEDVTYKATYTEEAAKYTIKFVNEDDSIIKELSVKYGEMPSAPTTVLKASTDEFKYTFDGWDKEVAIVTGDATYKAKFIAEKNKYTYRFLDLNNEVIKEESIEYGTTPVAPENPTKVSDEHYSYEFVGWDPEVGAITKDVIYVPVFNKILNATSLEGLKVSILGDSISTFYAAGSAINSYYQDQEGTYYYPKYCKNVDTVEKTWWMQLVNNTKMVLDVNNSWSGSCAYGSGSSAGMNESRLETLDENGNPDIVIVYLGTNDVAGGYDTNNIMTGIDTIVKYIQENYGATVFLTVLGYSNYHINQPDNHNKYSEEGRVAFNNALKEYAGKNNCGIIHLDEYVDNLSWSFYLNDNLHYNYKGTQLLAKVFEKSIKDYFNISFTEEITVEREEPLPEGVVGKFTVTANAGFWTNYATEVYLFAKGSAEKALYSLRVEVGKSGDDYVIKAIHQSGETVTSYGDDTLYVFVVSEGCDKYLTVKSAFNKVSVGDIVLMDPTQSFPFDVMLKKAN